MGPWLQSPTPLLSRKLESLMSLMIPNSMDLKLSLIITTTSKDRAEVLETKNRPLMMPGESARISVWVIPAEEFRDNLRSYIIFRTTIFKNEKNQRNIYKK